MKFSKESEYGILGLVALAKQPPHKVMLLSQIAKAQGLPQPFLAKTFQKFVQHGLVRSYRGAVRGYTLARPPQKITLREVIGAVEGPDFLDKCLFWNQRCSDCNPCLLHSRWEKIKPRLVKLIEGTTIKELAEEASRRRKGR